MRSGVGAESSPRIRNTNEQARTRNAFEGLRSRWHDGSGFHTPTGRLKVHFVGLPSQAYVRYLMAQSPALRPISPRLVRIIG